MASATRKKSKSKSSPKTAVDKSAVNKATVDRATVDRATVSKATVKATVGRARPKQRSATSSAVASDTAEPERSAPPLAEVDADALEFIEAIDRFKKQNGRPFPSWSEVLLVLRRLGYRRR
ncbi:MAG: hypothetical protein ABIP94_05395 [Planctomycetota bacterium]